MRTHWAQNATEQLRQGHTIQVRPRGHSMAGRVSDGALVTLMPCEAGELRVDDIVLVEIRGRRYSHLVLHQILERENERFLIGSHAGRVEGWVTREAIHAVVMRVQNA